MPTLPRTPDLPPQPLVSLPGSDAPTTVLMSEFYRSWQGGMNKAEALRQAMLATQAQFPNPKNWAALAIVGTGD